MKKFFFYLALGSMMMGSLTSCTADDDGPLDNDELWKGTLADAPYAADAACFRILDGDVKTIELTGSGLYFVDRGGSDDYNAPAKAFRKAAASASKKTLRKDWTPYQAILSGKFTRLEDGSYDLEGFGIVTWNQEDGTVTIRLQDGEDYIWDAVKEETVTSNELNNRLCRTWKIYEARAEFLDKNSKVIGSYTYTPAQVEEEFIEFFTFTRAGRMYEYDEGEWYLYTWRWSDPKNQICMVVGDDPSDGEGILQTFFDGDTMTIMNPWYVENYYYLYGDFEGLTEVPESTHLVKEYLTCRNYTVK